MTSLLKTFPVSGCCAGTAEAEDAGPEFGSCPHLVLGPGQSVKTEDSGK
jgi:hypothetical protein